MRNVIACNLLAGIILASYILLVVCGGVGEWRLPACADDGGSVAMAVLFAVLYLFMLRVCAAPDGFNLPVRTGDRERDRAVMRTATAVTNLCVMSALIPLAATSLTGDAWWIFLVFIFVAWRVSLFTIIGNATKRRKRMGDEK